MGCSVAIVSTVRDDVGEVERFITYHLGQGVQHIFLYLDAPEEWSAMAYSNDPRVHVRECSDQFWRQAGGRPAGLTQRQLHNANAALAEARDVGVDWITHIDQDELLYSPDGDIPRTLADCALPAVRYEMLEAIDTGTRTGSRFFADTFKKNISPKVAATLRSDPLLSGLLFDGEYFRGHKQSKIAVRVAGFSGRLGVHGIEGSNAPIPHAPGLLLLHYDCIGLATWKAKWSLRKVAIAGFGMRDNRKMQLALFNAAEGNADAERAAYEMLHVASGEQVEAGRRRGILKTLRIDPTLFDVPEDTVHQRKGLVSGSVPQPRNPTTADVPAAPAAPARIARDLALRSATLRTEIVERLYDVDPFEGFNPAGHVLDTQGWNGRHPALARAIGEVDARVCVDVGVWKGLSTLTMANAVGAGGVVIAVDTFLGSPEHWNRQQPDMIRSLQFRNGLPQLYWQFMANCVLTGMQDRIVPLAQTSSNAAVILKRRGIRADLVHVDAAHDFDSVLADLRAYFWNVLRPGGILMGDDYNWEEVKRAVDRFTANNHLTLEIDGPKWLLRKPEPALRDHDVAGSTSHGRG